MTKIEILIVDDSPAFNHLTILSIRRAALDCHITEMSNGQRALNYLATAKHPDVILLDINMPVMDGFDFLEEYVKAYRDTAKANIYILTSSSQDIDRIRAQSFGLVRGYFEKPLTRENINQMVADLSDLK